MHHLRYNFDSEGLCTPLSKHDRDFLQFVAAKDFLEHRESIKVSIQKEYPLTPLSSLVVFMDYMSIPMTTNVMLVSNCHVNSVDSDDERAERDSLLRQAAVRAGMAILLQVMVRRGHDHVDVSSEAMKRTKDVSTFPMVIPFSR